MRKKTKLIFLVGYTQEEVKRDRRMYASDLHHLNKQQKHSERQQEWDVNPKVQGKRVVISLRKFSYVWF